MSSSRSDVPEYELSECELDGASWLLQKAKDFVDCCDGEGLTKFDRIEAWYALIDVLERAFNEEKEKLNG